MKKLYSLAICTALLLSLCACGKPEEPELVYVDEGTEEVSEMPLRDVSILCTSGLAGKEMKFWAKLSALRQNDIYTYLAGYVGLVDLGGVVDNEENATYNRVELMNYLEYDAAAPAASDFSSGVQMLMNAANTAAYPLLCCNLYTAEKEARPLSSWTLVQYGGITVAFVGLTLPDAIDDPCLTDELENSYVLADSSVCLQEAANDARNAGAAYVIALCSCGRERAEALLSTINGVDVFLDGAGDGSCGQLTDAEGKNSAYLSLDANTENAGRVIIRENGSIETEIVTELEETNDAMAAYLASMGYEIEADDEAITESKESSTAE